MIKVRGYFTCGAWRQRVEKSLCIHRYKTQHEKCRGCPIGAKLLKEQNQENQVGRGKWLHF